MRVLFGFGHPAHVHFFKNTIWNLEEDGHEVRIVARDKEVTLKLLDAYGFEYELYGKYRKNLLGKILEIPYNDYLFYKVAKEFKPDILTGILNYTVTHIGRLINKPSIIFTDTEHGANKLVCPFADVICTPACYKIDFGKKQVRYEGYHQLAYLHPKYFKPDPGVLDELGLTKDDKYIIIRLISWNAFHDIHSKGFSQDFLEKVVKSFEEYGHVFITSEQELSKDFEKYRIKLTAEKLHSALYYSSLYFGEGGATAIESALLGTPTVHVEAFKVRSNKVVDATKIHGIFDELVNKYGLLYTFFDQNQATSKALEILQDKNVKKDFEKRREQLIKEKIDITAFMTNFIKNYPESFHEYKNSKEI